MLHWRYWPYWLFSWCLMSNHLHLVLGTPRASLPPAMKWLPGAHALRDFTKLRTLPRPLPSVKGYHCGE